MPYSASTKLRRAAFNFVLNWWPAEARRRANLYRRYDEQEHARFSALLARVADLPPAALLIERATLCCPRCRAMLASEPFRNNAITCPNCSSAWKVQAWILPRKSGQPPRMCDAAFQICPSDRYPCESEMERINLLPIFRNVYLTVWKGAYQCAICGHLNRMRYSARNSYQSGRCKRHWEILIKVESLSADAPSCKNISAEDREVAPPEAIISA